MFPAIAKADHLEEAHFPRKANYFLRWLMSEGDARELAKWDVVILDMEIQRRYPERLELMRQINPDIILLVYITPQEIIEDAATSWSVLRRELRSQIADEWFLTDARGHTLSWWPKTQMLNVTNEAPLVSGKRWNSVLVDFVVTRLLSTGLWDGVFYDNTWDNVTYFVGPNTDIDMNQRTDSRAFADAAWQEGMTYIYDETRRRTDDRFIIVGNGNTKAYTASLNGKLIENFLAFSWEPTVNQYKANHDHSVYRPQVNILNANTANGRISQSDYRHFRFGLMSALLEDGYYSFDYGDRDHGQTWWYDEYGVNLGGALADAAPQNGASVYQADVWTREFEHGIAVVNATNDQKVIALPGEYEALRGTQDPVVNNGAIISALQVGALDGQILLKTYEQLPGVPYVNGAFIRFFRPHGERVRNGFFSFHPRFDGGAHVASMDLNGDEQPDHLVLSGNKLEAWRHDEQRFLTVYPFSAQFQARMRLAVGDVTGNGNMEFVVAPAPGSNATQGVKVYDLNGEQVGEEFHPFGKGYIGGYSVAVIDGDGNVPGRLVIGAGAGFGPMVRLYTLDGVLESQFYAYEQSFRGGVNVAAGDVNGDGIAEIVTGPGQGGKAWIRVFDQSGLLNNQSNFEAYSSFGFPGIDVRVMDVDFDGVGDIVGVSESF